MHTSIFSLRLFSFIIILCGVTTLSAQSEPMQKPLVVSSASIFADMASAIGGNLIESVSVVPIGGDPHIYEPTPGDVTKLANAELILENGLTFEGWISDLVKNSGSKAPVITLSEGIIPVRSKQHQNATDPHAWMDPVNGKIYAHNIKAALLKILPNDFEQITVQFEDYLADLDTLDIYVREQIARIDTSKRILITSHDSFHYYTKRYGLQSESVLGTSTDADVRTSDIIRLNEVIQKHKIPVVFTESTINPKLLNQVAKDNKIAVGGKLFSDSLGDKDSPANTYLNMIRYNTDVIVAGLTSSNDASGRGQSKKSSGTLIWIALAILLVSAAIFLMRKRIVAA